MQKCNIQEAVTFLLENSRLRKIVCGGGDPTDWPRAAQEDAQAVNALGKNIVEDINLLLIVRSRQLLLDSVFRLPTEKLLPGQTDYERAFTLHEALKETTWIWLNNLLGRMQPQDGTVPLLPVSTFRKVGDTIEFNWADTPINTTLRKMIRVVYAQDLPVSQQVVCLQDIAKHATHFEYRPAILSGVLTNGFAVSHALVLQTGMDKDIMVAYWSDRTEPDWLQGIDFAPPISATVATAVFGSFGWLIGWLANWSGGIIVLSVLSFLLTACCIIGAVGTLIDALTVKKVHL